MQRVIGLALLAIGVVLLIMGINSADSFASEVSEFFTNSPTDKSIWLTIGGIGAIIVGAGLAALPGRFFGGTGRN